MLDPTLTISSCTLRPISFPPFFYSIVFSNIKIRTNGTFINDIKWLNCMLIVSFSRLIFIYKTRPWLFHRYFVYLLFHCNSLFSPYLIFKGTVSLMTTRNCSFYRFYVCAVENMNWHSVCYFDYIKKKP